MDKIKDISQFEALRLVKIAFNLYGRDEAYISRLVDYIALNPAIHKPAAVLTTLIKQDRIARLLFRHLITKPLTAREGLHPASRLLAIPSRLTHKNHPDFGDSYGALTRSSCSKATSFQPAQSSTLRTNSSWAAYKPFRASHNGLGGVASCAWSAQCQL